MWLLSLPIRFGGVQATQRNGEVAAERARLEEASLPLMLDAMWAANLIDIQSTVRHVCRKVGRVSTRTLLPPAGCPLVAVW